MSQPRILCIEDEPDFLEDIVEFLESENFSVSTAINGEEGIERFIEDKPDIVLCDIQMPSMTGFEMLESLNLHHGDRANRTPFVFLTAWGDKQHHISAKTLGCDDFLVKPIDFDMLLATLHGRLNKWQKASAISDSSLGRFQTQMLNTMHYQLKKPLHAIISYADLMEQEKPEHIENYTKQITDIATKQLGQIQSMMDTIAILTMQYIPSMQSYNLAHLLWESAVVALGYDKANQLISSHNAAPEQNTQLDVGLIMRCLQQLILMVGKQHNAPLKLHCKAGDKATVAITIAACETRLAQDDIWISLINDYEPYAKQQPDLMYYHGATLLFVRAAAQLHQSTIKLEISAPCDPVIRWEFNRS